MKFTSDKQRKAIFANMNKFAAKSGTGERLMPVFDQYGISEQTMAETYLPPRDIVEGYTGAMITVDRFNKNEGPIVIYDLTDKDKKEFMKAYKEGDVIPEHIDRGYRREKPENTIILAGEDYKVEDPGSISHMIIKGNKSFNEEELSPRKRKDAIRDFAEIERISGEPVYSDRPKIIIKSAELFELLNGNAKKPLKVEEFSEEDKLVQQMERSYDTPSKKTTRGKLREAIQRAYDDRGIDADIDNEYSRKSLDEFIKEHREEIRKRHDN